MFSESRVISSPQPIEDAARELGVSVSTLRRWIGAGAPVARCGGQGRGRAALVDPAAVRAWLDRCDAEQALVALAGRIPELLAEAAEEAFVACPDKRGAGWALCFQWQLASAKLLDALREDAPGVPELEVVPESIEKIRKLITE